jgi:CO/xanthine dehydrogenase FAD-binding subunit
MFDQVEAFYRPAGVAEALRLLQRGKGRARIVAGGTDVVVAGGEGVRALIDLTHAGLSYIRRKSAGLAVGATTTLAEIEESELLGGTAGGILSRAAATCGSVPIRNLATLGGNMANASAAADMATPLLVLDASAVVANARGRRKLPLADYLRCAAAGHLSNAILVEVIVPAPPRARRCGWSFQKLGRTAVDISLVNVAAGLGLDAKGRVQWARLALGSVAPTALRASAAEQRMAGRIADRALIAEAAAQVALTVSPISDVRASAEYRRDMGVVLSVRALEECVTRAGGSL